MKRLVMLMAVVLTGCSIKAEFSMMKQWDRPAEKITVEDTSHNVKQPPRTVIETQENISVNPPIIIQKESAPAPQIKPMNFEVPEVIVPKATPIQYMYFHEHGDDKHTCYVRKTVGMFAQNLTH